MAGDELLGVAEIAARFQVARNTAWRWSRRPDFPQPVAKLEAGPVWKAVDVDRWKRERVPARTGRPPKPAT